MQEMVASGAGSVAPNRDMPLSVHPAIRCAGRLDGDGRRTPQDGITHTPSPRRPAQAMHTLTPAGRTPNKYRLTLTTSSSSHLSPLSPHRTSMPRTTPSSSSDGDTKPSKTSKPYDRKPGPKGECKPKTEHKPKTEPAAAPSAPSAWTPAECLALFDHVKTVGERQWEDAVPGRSGPVSRKAWWVVIFSRADTQEEPRRAIHPQGAREQERRRWHRSRQVDV